MSENNFVINLRNKFRTMYGADGDWQRLEDKLSVGIPDINAVANGQEWWLEAKYMDAMPPRRMNAGLKPAQKIWLQRSAKVGRRTGMLLGVRGHGNYFIPPVSLWVGAIDVAYFAELDKRRFATADTLLHFVFNEAANVVWKQHGLQLMK